MSLALVSIEVWRGSGSSAAITVYQDDRRIDRVIVMPGDTLDLELEDGMRATVGPMPREEEDAAEYFAGQDAAAALEEVP